MKIQCDCGEWFEDSFIAEWGGVCSTCKAKADLKSKTDTVAKSPAAMAGSAPLRDECREEIKGEVVICPDCCCAIHEDCAEQEDGEMCCPICAEDRRMH